MRCAKGWEGGRGRGWMEQTKWGLIACGPAGHPARALQGVSRWRREQDARVARLRRDGAAALQQRDDDGDNRDHGARVPARSHEQPDREAWHVWSVGSLTLGALPLRRVQSTLCRTPPSRRCLTPQRRPPRPPPLLLLPMLLRHASHRPSLHERRRRPCHRCACLPASGGRCARAPRDAPQLASARRPLPPGTQVNGPSAKRPLQSAMDLLSGLHGVSFPAAATSCCSEGLSSAASAIGTDNVEVGSAPLARAAATVRARLPTEALAIEEAHATDEVVALETNLASWNDELARPLRSCPSCQLVLRLRCRPLITCGVLESCRTLSWVGCILCLPAGVSLDAARVPVQTVSLTGRSTSAVGASSERVSHRNAFTKE
eukprot:scaffold3032_cov375-Prasinococcus_capsulatus_cf.AAC.2